MKGMHFSSKNARLLNSFTSNATRIFCRESRVGDACFFIEKVLDQICEFDSQCAQFVLDCRKKLWPDYHEQEAKRDEERERQEAEEKKKRAKVIKSLTRWLHF